MSQRNIRKKTKIELAVLGAIAMERRGIFSASRSLSWLIVIAIVDR
jgi:hypothetical protein